MADPVLTATLSGQRAILLSWTFDTSADFQVFWKSSVPAGQEYVLLATTNEFSYTTPDLDASKTYDFYVRANVGATYFYSNVVELFVSCGKGVVLSVAPPDPPPPQVTPMKSIVFADHNNHRIVRLLALDLSDVYYLGSYYAPGLSNYQFYYPTSACYNGTNIFIADKVNHRIVKRDKNPEMDYVSEIGTNGFGDNQFTYPMGITSDSTYIYVVDNMDYPTYTTRIIKRLASDLSFISKNEGLGLREGNQIAYGGGYLYVADSYNNRIVKILASDLSYVSEIGTLGSSNDQFNYPQGVAYWSPYIYVIDRNNHRIVKRNSDNAMGYVSQFGSDGSGVNNLHFPHGIATDGTYLYITDTGNARIMKRVLADYSYVTHIGSLPVGPAHQQFNAPTGICFQS